MQTFQEYYEPHVSGEKIIDALSDPSLSHEKDRADVNRLLMNLVIRYVAEYLEMPPEDIEAINSKVKKSVKISPDDMMQIFVDVYMKAEGMPHTSSGFSQTDRLSLESLVDIRATAAIMKEIIFGGKFEVEQGEQFADNFIALDLGHGTGVLMLAAQIAALRKQIAKILVVGVDISPEAISNSRRTLAKFMPEEEFKIERADIVHPMIWNIFDGLPLSYVISETIGPSTPAMVRQNGVWRMVSQPNGNLEHSLTTHADVDPFPQVVLNALACRPDLEDDIRDGRTAMFPDIIGGKFKPDARNSTLILTTGEDQTPLLLHEVGKEFRNFEEFEIENHRRWQEGPVI